MVPKGTISFVALPPPFTGVIVKAIPEQIVAVVLAMVGLGFTVTIMVKVFPTQFPVAPDVGVTV